MKYKYVRCRASYIYEVVLEPNCNLEKVVLRTRDKSTALIILEHHLREKHNQDIAIRTIKQVRYTLVERE